MYNHILLLIPTDKTNNFKYIYTTNFNVYSYVIIGFLSQNVCILFIKSQHKDLDYKTFIAASHISYNNLKYYWLPARQQKK